MKTIIEILFTFILFTSFLFSQSLQWQPLNGPFGGTPLCFVSKSNGNLFAGMSQDERGIFKSTDNGLTWFPKNNGIPLLNRDISWITVDDSNYIIIGTNSHIGARIYKSTNDGESWFETENLGGTSVTKNANGHLYVGNTAYQQYSVSTDAGYNWTHYTHPSPSINCIEINDSGHIFVGGGYTGYRSTDNGSTWTNLSLPDGINSFAFAPNGDIYAGCSREYASNSGIYRSTDNGNSWTPVKEGIRVYPTRNIVINNNGGIFVGSYGWGIWRSIDNGATWTQKNSGLGHFYIKSMHISSDGNIYAGTGGGIYRSTDNGNSWYQVGVTVALVKGMTISPLNGYIFTLVNGIARSTDNGLSWSPMNSGLISYDTRQITIKNDGTIFCGLGANDNGILFRSTNNGVNWIRSDTGLAVQTVNGIATDSDGNVYVGIENNGVYKSTNNGSNWFKIGNPPSGKLAFNSVGDLFLASWGGGLWKLPAGDTVWINITGTLYPYIDCIFIGSNDYIYAAKNRSTDNGATWTSLSIPGNNVYSYTENSLGHLFCGTYNYGGVFRSTDYGITWESINTALPTQDVRCVAVDTGSYLYAGPWGYSLYKTTTSTVTSVEEERYTPTSFYLEQNYPNPFNPSTTISWQSPASGWQTIKLYDLMGREIETIVSGYYEAGSHSTLYIVNSSLPSGVYFYQLKADEFVQTRKMILLR